MGCVADKRTRQGGEPSIDRVAAADDNELCRLRHISNTRLDIVASLNPASCCPLGVRLMLQPASRKKRGRVAVGLCGNSYLKLLI